MFFFLHYSYSLKYNTLKSRKNLVQRKQKRTIYISFLFREIPRIIEIILRIFWIEKFPRISLRFLGTFWKPGADRRYIKGLRTLTRPRYLCNRRFYYHTVSCALVWNYKASNIDAALKHSSSVSLQTDVSIITPLAVLSYEIIKHRTSMLLWNTHLRFLCKPAFLLLHR